MAQNSLSEIEICLCPKYELHRELLCEFQTKTKTFQELDRTLEVYNPFPDDISSQEIMSFADQKILIQF